MKSIFKVGLTIGVLCAIWQLLMAATGWLTNPRLFGLFYFVILIEIAVLISGLKGTKDVKTYGGQLLSGTGASVVAGIFLFLFSLVLILFLFPGLMGEMRAMQEDALRRAGQPEAQIQAALAFQTPLFQAAMGFIGTVVTGFLASLAIAAFLRKKSEPAM